MTTKHFGRDLTGTHGRYADSPVRWDIAPDPATHVENSKAEIPGLIQMMARQPVFFICDFTSGDLFSKKLPFVT